jgi:hypothetical protein
MTAICAARQGHLEAVIASSTAAPRSTGRPGDATARC